MNSPAPRSAREWAYCVLEEHRRSSHFLTEVIARLEQKWLLPELERSFLRELVAGVTRRKLTLQSLVQPFLRQPFDSLEPGLQTLLQLGCYQLAFLATADYAAIFETVEVAKRFGRSRWTGMLNAVLRKVQQNLGEEIPGLEPQAIPLSADRYRRFQAAWLPDPGTDFADYFSQAFSFPRWLVDRWRLRFSEAELVGLGYHFNTPPGLTFRINRLRTDAGKLAALFQSSGLSAQFPDEHSFDLLTEPAPSLAGLPGFAEGEFTVQDRTAIQAGLLLNPQPGERAWDMCAAPGTKTSHLAELMQNRGSLLATDISKQRLELIQENKTRLGLDVIQTWQIAPDSSNLPPGPFDAILLDAPCSNTGVLNKRPEARWRITPADISELAELQYRLLTAALARLSPRSRLVYSTCSIEPEENQHQIQRLLHTQSHWRLHAIREFRPGQHGDGGFQALLKRQ